MSTPAISVQNLSKHYNNVPALDGVNLELPHGSIGLLGANGAGKSTFIKLALGLLTPTSGSASVLGYNVADRGIELRRAIGYMPEDECLPTDMSGYDFVVRMGRLSGLPREAALQRAFDVLNLVGLGEARYRVIGEYSVGMKQRVKLAQALVHDPKLVLMDEPTSGLDPEGRDEMLEIIRDIRQKMGISMLLSTHLLIDVERVCDWVIIIKEGNLISSGPLDSILAEAPSVRQKVQLRVVGDRDAFISSLEQAGMDVIMTESDFMVEAEAEGMFDRILDSALSTGVQLRRMESRGRSLEEHFLELHDEHQTDQ